MLQSYHEEVFGNGLVGMRAYVARSLDGGDNLQTDDRCPLFHARGQTQGHTG